MNDHEWFDQIDRDWNAIVTKSGHPRKDDPMTETMARLHNLATASVPSQTIDRVWNRLPVPSRPAVVRPARHIRPLWSALDSRPISAVATIALLVLITTSGYFAVNSSRVSTPPVDSVNYRLLSTIPGMSLLREIDPLTLEDVPDGLAYPFTELATPSPDQSAYSVDKWLASADGSRLIGWVQQDYIQNQSTIFVVDPVAGTVLRHISIAADPTSVTIDASGGRVAVEIGGGIVERIPSTVITRKPVRWDIYDTTTGQLLSRIESLNDRDPILSGSGWFDPSGRLFYRFATDQADVDPGPWPVQLVLHDAVTGLELDRLDLPSVRAGVWLSEPSERSSACGLGASSDDDEPILSGERAGVSISPNGSTMAILHPDGQEMTLIDLPAMQEIRTVTLPSNTFATPISEGDTACPTPIASVRNVWFSPDGESLYVMGMASPTAVQTPAQRVVKIAPMMRVDVASGAVAARVTVDESASMVLAPLLAQSPDGHTLYTVRYALLGTSTIIERRDAETLAVLASHEHSWRGDLIVIAK